MICKAKSAGFIISSAIWAVLHLLQPRLKMSKSFAAIAVAVSGLVAAVCLQVTSVGAAGGAQAASAVPAKSAAAAIPAGPPRALLDQYCVTCHNDRLKTAGLSLEK